MSLIVAVSGVHRGENPQPGAGVIRSLRRRFDDLVIVGLVYDVFESGIYADDCADIVFQMPFPKQGSAALLERIDWIRRTYPVDVLIPTLDAELNGMIRVQSQLAARNIRMLLPSMSSYHASKKQELSKMSASVGCLTPRTLAAVEVKGLVEAAESIGYPVMVKGPYYGAVKVFRRAALIEQFEKIIVDWGGPVLVQQCLHGSEFDVVGVGDGQGGLGGYCAIRKTLVSEKGKGFGGIVVRDPKLDQIASDIVKALNWRGPFELEFIKHDVTGEYYLMEINPRFPAWVDFPSSFGHNLPALVVDTLLNGEMPVLPACDAGKFFIRHSVELTGDLTQLEQLSTLGELRCGENSYMPSHQDSTAAIA